MIKYCEWISASDGEFMGGRKRKSKDLSHVNSGNTRF